MRGRGIVMLSGVNVIVVSYAALGGVVPFVVLGGVLFDVEWGNDCVLLRSA